MRYERYRETWASAPRPWPGSSASRYTKSPAGSFVLSPRAASTPDAIPARDPLPPVTLRKKKAGRNRARDSTSRDVGAAARSARKRQWLPCTARSVVVWHVHRGLTVHMRDYL